MGNHLSGVAALTELDALLATRFPASPGQAMFFLDALPIWAVVVIVIDLSVLRRVLLRVRVVRRYLHCGPSLLEGEFIVSHALVLSFLFRRAATEPPLVG